jgi:hypothetical protein
VRHRTQQIPIKSNRHWPQTQARASASRGRFVDLKSIESLARETESLIPTHSADFDI